MQVTISLLHSSLALVHIPRPRLHQLSHPILKQILQPHPTFLNITCNEVELSLFAEESALADFEPIARKDRHKKRARSNSASGRRSVSHGSDIDSVEVSHERWSVLQVDSHNDQIDNSGARVNEVSAPLAAAGISILYQSSYMSDFILVKKSRLQDTMNLLAEAGFDIYASGSDSTPINSVRPKDRSSVHDFRSPNIVVPSMTRARSGTDPAGSKMDSRSVWNQHQSPGITKTPPRKKSNSPTAGDVRLLPSDLACVGLSEEQGADHWGLKIVKLVAFPELISSPSLSRAPLTPISPPIFSLPLFSRKSSTPLFDFSPPDPDSTSHDISSNPSSPTTSSSEDDGYFSRSPKKSLSESLPQPVSRSQTDLRKPPAISLTYKHHSKHLIEPLSLVTFPLDTSNHHGPTLGMPFFSYTRTAEGSSLTADVYVLAALFPPAERHMVICSGELDAADRGTLELSSTMNWLDDTDAEDGDSQGNILSCLQIDLQRFGLDKYGLVNRFSKVLEENKINHMYSSSFKTANLLVDKKNARRAQALLCSC